MKKENIKEIIIYALILLAVILIRSFVVTPVRVNGPSMNTTLRDKEIMILSKIDYVFNDIERFDIVVVDVGDEYIIKRVIGLPGETVEYKDDQLFINDKLVTEYFKNQSTEDFSITEIGYEKIPEDYYFVLGDNRKESMDSRDFGFVHKGDIKGSANLVIWPLKEFGIKK